MLDKVRREDLWPREEDQEGLCEKDQDLRPWDLDEEEQSWTGRDDPNAGGDCHRSEGGHWEAKQQDLRVGGEVSVSRQEEVPVSLSIHQSNY